jgi:hypothetical protein
MFTGCESMMEHSGPSPDRDTQRLLKASKPYEEISKIPPHGSASTRFSPSVVKTVAVIAVAPGDSEILLNHAFSAPTLAKPTALNRDAIRFETMFSRLTLPPNRRSMVETAVEETLLSRGYRLAARSDIDHVLKELNMPASSLTSDDGAAKMGKMINTDAVLVVRVNQALIDSSDRELLLDGKSVRLSRLAVDVGLRLVAVEAGEAVWIGSKNVSGLYNGSFTLDGTCADVARDVARTLPKKVE